MSEPSIGSPSRLRVLGAFLVGILAILPGAVWIWLSTRSGHDPSIWNYVVLGLGAMVLAVLLTEALIANPSDNARTIALVVVVGLVVGGGWFWAKGQVGTLGRAFSEVCRGTPAQEAGAWEAGGPGPYHVMVLDEEGGKSRFTNVDAEWKADSVDDVELVACVREQMREIQTCHYTGNVTIDRYTEKVAVKVVVARSAQVIGSFKLEDLPRECPYNAKDAPSDLKGEVPLETLTDRLMPFIEGGTKADNKP